MTAEALLEKFETLKGFANRPRRVSLTELARSKDWRDQLPECGLMEVSDKNGSGTAAWLVSEQFMYEIVELLNASMEELEHAQVKAIVDSRSEVEYWATGDALANEAFSVWENRKDVLRKALHDDV